MVVDANVSIGGVSFTQFVLNSLPGHENVQAKTVMSNGGQNKSSSVVSEDLYALPENALQVLDRYFECRNILTPMFHVPSARPAFQAAICCPLRDRHKHRLEYVLLNMVLALCTSHWLVDVDANPRTARQHYDTAMALLQPTILRDWTLQHVQALLLGARYLQGTSCGDECWNVLGLAIRIAYGLRLHQEPPETDAPPLRETKRRVWYAAYTLDMHWSMVYQRPPATRSSDFSISMLEDLDDDCIQSDRILYPSPRRPSSMSFFIEVVKLYQIVEKVLARLSESQGGNRETAELAMGFDEEWQRWYRERPANLMLDETAAKEPPWILALRGNMVRILIHRQSLKIKAENSTTCNDSVVTHILQFSQKICVKAAMESIDIVALRHAQTKRTSGLDFFNIYYLFNAVIVLVSHIVDPQNAHDRTALDKVDEALHMINAMSSNHSFAQWAYSFLQQLLGYLHQSTGAQQPQPMTIPQSSIPLRQSTGSMASQTAVNRGSEELQDLHALFGLAQDLTVDLETQFGILDPGISESFWAFDDETSFSSVAGRS
ncbi:uncharacterized protein N7482_007606 [Penicillium canariense]|uniref:Xylanolytic transcriptional activator regulatory domain-containing protein n=1 Tax=Penicillium canariense TaxID=189055 RepID=A0A9W9I011_9EURO|nr:uncharacterized protein N7482_007606 [Penicillium canariense]KAJ5160602.1 hypothetical protein N7482_007606 [Penicillium canariense]